MWRKRQAMGEMVAQNLIASSRPSVRRSGQVALGGNTTQHQMSGREEPWWRRRPGRCRWCWEYLGKGAVGDVEDNVDEAAMQIDLTSRAADVQADTQSTWETTDENIDLVASQGSGERGSQREVS